MSPIVTTVRIGGRLQTLNLGEDTNRAVERYSSKRLSVTGLTYITLPVAHVPAGVAQSAWDRLARINDDILDHVTYDYARAGSPKPDGVQPPEVTWRRGQGVCMDYAALCEQHARRAGQCVRSIRSDALNHAWNEVLLEGRWWIIDVTWNGSDSLADGRPVPARIRRDPDFRKRYFLTTVANETELHRRGLLHHTHQCTDAKPVDYEKTLDAIALTQQITPLIDYRNILVRRTPQPHPEIKALDAQIEALYGRYLKLAAAYPLAVSYSFR